MLSDESILGVFRPTLQRVHIVLDGGVGNESGALFCKLDGSLVAHEANHLTAIPI